MRVVCYYTNWSVYRPGEGKFSPQNINPYLCTHLIYAFGGFTKENTLKPFDKYQDIEKGGYAKFTGLKTYNKNLKTLLAIGGWNEGSTRFSPMVATAERRKEFAKNAIKFLRLNHFDGLDLDWEYPSFRDGGKPRDRDNYPLLVQELREEFEREAEKTGRPRLLLTMAVPAGIEYINKGFDVPKLTKYLDWMNILSYDFHSAFEPAVNHHAPLYSLEEESEYNYESDLNIDYAIKHYLKKGAEPNKLVLGIPTYGRSYTLYNPEAFEIGSPADGPGNMGSATRENGYLAYYEICDYVKNHDWEVEEPNPEVMGPYAFKDDQWVGYDDEEIVKKKAEYVVENDLGGIMFWSIDNDDFRGNCHGKPYPLIEAGRAALINAYGITDDNLIAPLSKPSKTRSRTRTKTDESDTEKNKKSEKFTTTSRRRNRIRQNKDDSEDKEISTKRKTQRNNARKKEQETSSYSNLKIVTPSYTTPAPPSTPELDGAFKCEDEGFYPHPKDCKKYFWCLNGAGDSGIIAHQFTCPAGLYFNKAADSCDYTQNVICKKSVKKTTTSTTKAPEALYSSSTTSSSPIFSTTRAPPKITAATSRTTFRQTTTTTTEAYEDEGYDDEEYDEEEENKKDSEEDPKVIKELIELIRKAGGIEELEKQFKIKGNSSTSEQAPTKSPIFSKSIYEKVLSKAIKNTPSSKTDRNLFFQNSRGPQSEKTELSEKSESQTKNAKGKLQYTSISRFRPSREKETGDENKKDQVQEQNLENQTNKKASEKYPSYTNIRRARVSTTTEVPVNDRNKILGETDEDDDDTNDDIVDEGDGDYVQNTKRTFTPQYVNIRRQRPSTTEETSTSKYLEIRKGTTENSTSAEDNLATYKYKILRRGTTTTNQPKTDDTNLSSTVSGIDLIPTSSTSEIIFSRSTTTDDAENSTSENNRNEYLPNIITTTGTFVTTTDDINFIKSESSDSKGTETTSISSKPNLLNTFQRKRPQLFEPRPFTKSSEASTSRPRTTQATKVSETSFDLTSDSENNKVTREKSNINFKSRGSSRFNPIRNINTAAEDKKNQKVISRRRIVVTEKYIEEQRPYRPSEIADLSSLTAVDFDNIKGLNSRTNSRRRPLIKVTTDKIDDLQNTPSTLKRKRIYLINNDTKSEEYKKTRDFYRTDSTTEASSPSPSRSRKIIRRLRTSTFVPILSPNLDTNSTIRRNHPLLKPSTTVLDLSQKNNEVDDDGFEDSTTEEDENIKLSESNIRENSDINSFKPDPKLRQKLFKSDELYGKSNIYFKNLGKIEPSTEPPKIGFSSTTSTEPNVFNRTRKIIRKIIPTQTTKIVDIEADSDQIFGRKRKIIRKLRPTFALITTSTLFSTNKPKESENFNSYEETTVSSIPKLDRDEVSKFPKRLFRPKFNSKRVTPVTIEAVTIENTTKDLLKNKTVLLRAPSRKLRPTFNSASGKYISTETPVDLEKASIKYKFKSRRPSLLSKPTTETVTKQLGNIITTEPTEVKTSISDYTTESIITTHNFGTENMDEISDSTTENNLIPFKVEKQKKFEVSGITTENILTTFNIHTEKMDETTDSTTENILTKYNIDKKQKVTISDSTTETFIPYNLDKKITTDITTIGSFLSETITTTEFTSTENLFNNTNNEFSSEINTKFTDDASTILEFEVTSIKLSEEGGNEYTTIKIEKTSQQQEVAADITTQLPETTVFVPSSTENQEPSSIHYRSTLRTIDSRPTFNPSHLKQLTSSQTTDIKPIKPKLYYRNRYQPSIIDDSLPKSTTEKLLVEPEIDTKNNKFNKYSQGYRTSENITSEAIESISILPIKKSLYKYRKPKPQNIEHSQIKDKVQNEENINENQEAVIDKPKNRFVVDKYTRTTRPSIKSKSKLPSFIRTTTEETIKNENLKDVDAVKDKNKSLFKNRKVNSNLLSPSTYSSMVTVEESTTYYDYDNSDSTTQITESGEHPTTLVHVFADKGDSTQTTTEGLDKMNYTTTSKVERLIEVNRIINVNTKEEIIKKDHIEHVSDKESSPFYDKIGAINRVTVIKVVDKDGKLVNNETSPLSPVYISDSQTTESPIKSSVDMIIQIAKIQEIPRPLNTVNLTNITVQIQEQYPLIREERKLDFIGGSKQDYSKIRNIGKAEIIDGIAHINVITPRPIYLTESSTIALEGLFQTEKPTLFTNKNAINDELLETEHSKFVNVRILHPDEEVRLSKDIENPQVVPIKLLKQDVGDFVIKARVVEVSPKSTFNTIKIIPIKVEAAKKMPPPLPLIRINRQHN